MEEVWLSRKQRQVDLMIPTEETIPEQSQKADDGEQNACDQREAELEIRSKKTETEV